MACHVRVAEPTATFGQPEVRLNLLPGYGGTQRCRACSRPPATRSRWCARSRSSWAGARGPPKCEATASCMRSPDDAEDVVSRTSALRLAAEYVAAPRRRRGRAGLRGAPRGDGRVARPGAGARGALADPEVRDCSRRRAGRPRGDRRRASSMRCAPAGRRASTAGLEREARLFAEAIVDPDGGKAGIQAFFDKQSAPLPTRSARIAAEAPSSRQRRAAARGRAVLPGSDADAAWQYGHAVVRRIRLPARPTTACRRRRARDPRAGADARAERGAGLRARLRGELQRHLGHHRHPGLALREPRSRLPGHRLRRRGPRRGARQRGQARGAAQGRRSRHRLQRARATCSRRYAARDPMYAGFASRATRPIRAATSSSCCAGPAAASRAARSHARGGRLLRAEPRHRHARAVHDAADRIRPHASSSKARPPAPASRRSRAPRATGSRRRPRVERERAAFVKPQGGAGAINRKDPRWAKAYTPVPPGPRRSPRGKPAGEPICEAMRAQTGGRLADYAVSHAGQESFPRSFQLLAEGGTLTFYGATSGYWFSFVGKRGSAAPEDHAAPRALRAGEAVLLYYGVGEAGRGAAARPGRPRGDRGGARHGRAARRRHRHGRAARVRAVARLRRCRARRRLARGDQAPQGRRTSSGRTRCRRCRMPSARPRPSRRPCAATRSAR
jgi:acrylyl-CoA reductase (NADPH) / 3-hydroxypropionyl-CoA dehydratase / 3-hydroxypropionyl-CoA synthetase